METIRKVQIMSNNQKIVDKLKAKNWQFYVSRKFNWFVENTQILVNSSDIFNKYLNFDCSIKNYLILNGDEYSCEKDSDIFNNVFREQLLKDDNFFEHFSKKIFEISVEIKNYYQILRISDFSSLTDNQLMDRVREFQEMYTKSFVAGWSRPDDFLQTEIELLLKKELNLGEKESEEVFSVLAICPDIGELDYCDEPLALLNIAQEIKAENLDLNNLPDEINQKISAHQEKYSWMKGPLLIEEIQFERGEYCNRIQLMMEKDIDQEINKILSARKQRLVAYSELIQKYKFGPTLQNLIEALQKFIFLRTFTTELSDKLFFLARKTLLKECAQRLHLDGSQVVSLQSSEIVDLLQGDNIEIKKIIAARGIGFAIIWTDGRCETVFGDQALSIQQSLQTEDREDETVEIRGKSASPGKISGRAKVLLSYQDVDKVKRGDILVASMTTPEYISAMEKASAFITDEGGITCHAAIIAREFGIPCIIGTKNATKILHDGDLVEVDADKGSVTIIKKG